ncbi:MAG: NAD(P)-dependent oxidoreductase [Gammaproteobacteria bacterium]
MGTLLVIGGSGFFGKSILDSFAHGRLEAFGIRRVVALARNASRLAVEAPALVSPAVDLVNEDITSLRELPEADLIIHAAASSDARRYAAAPEKELANIVDGATYFCDLVSRTAPKAKLLYCSSGAVYGRQPGGLEHIPEDYAALEAEGRVDQAKEAYTRGKRQAEAVLRRFAEERSTAVCIARCFAFVGTWLPRDQHFAIGNFLRDAMEGREITVKAVHPVYRSYMHADDLVGWLLRMTAAASDACPIYNVGSDEAVEIGELAAMIGEMCGVPVATPSRRNFRSQDFAPGRVDRYVPSIVKAQQTLGLRITYGLRDAIARTVDSISRTGR